MDSFFWRLVVMLIELVAFSLFRLGIARHAYVAVYPDGRVCISILHPPGEDPSGYELASERWTPVHTVESIVLSIISMLSSPNDESPANIEAAKEWREKRDDFKKKAGHTLGSTVISQVEANNSDETPRQKKQEKLRSMHQYQYTTTTAFG
ncbi:hypothetical protein ABZP36_025366 [Zizania latifolia]